jgi:hypothetical protein
MRTVRELGTYGTNYITNYCKILAPRFFACPGGALRSSCMCVARFFIVFCWLECIGHSFSYVAHFLFLIDVWIRTQRAGLANRRTTNLAVLRIRDVYPGSRILIFTHPGSRISDPGSRIPDPKTIPKERDEKILLSYFFL